MNKFLAMGIASRRLLTVLLAFIAFESHAQKEYYNWSFGEGVGLSFLNTPATLYTHNIGSGGATQQVYEGMASISDGAGNLRFSTNGLSVWQANGAIMAGGNNTLKGSDDGGGVSSAQGVLVVGAPKNKDLYYIFTNDAGNMIGTNPLGFNYCTVDMTANGGLGQVSAITRLKTAANLDYTTTEMCAVVPASNGCDIWVLTRQSVSNKILAYAITPAGINPVPVESDFTGDASRIALSNDLPYSINDEGRGSLTFSNSGDKFVMVHHDQSWPYYDAIQLFDFNRSTGVATYSCEIGDQGWNSAVIGYDAVWSPDDSKIYVSFGGIWDIYQYDVTAWGNRAAIKATQAVVPGTAIGGGPVPTGQMLIGPDGLLYRARKDVAYLATISGNLNGPVAGLTYNPNAYDLGAFCGGCISDAALPNMAPILVINADIDTTGVNPVCDSDAPFNLVATPPGGTWSASCGACITDANLGTFSPLIAGAGTHSIYYTISSCNADTVDIVVQACSGCKDTTLAPSIPAVCSTNGTINLSLYQGTAAAGTWSIVSGGGTANISGGNTFNINNTPAGNYVVQYTVAAQPGGCGNNPQRTIRVNLPNVTLTLGDNAACVNEAAFNLSGGSPIGGTYSGTGVGVSPSFNPGTAGVGPHTITYTYTDGNSCSASATATLTVNALTPVTFTLPDDQICINEGTINLSGGAPSGGTYSGTGVTVSPIFNPITAGLGSKTITYTITDGNGCVNSANDDIVVNDTTAVTLVLADNAACISEGAFNLSGGNPVGGSYSGAGVTSPSFDPSVAGVGTHTITYTYSNGSGCTTDATDVITVNDLPVVTFSLADDAACIDEAAFALSGGSPNGGDYSGSGITVSPTFDPANAGGAGKKQITYTYTDGNGCVNSATDSITVNALPVVSLTLTKDEACINEAAFALGGGSPTPGTYSGTGVSGGNFDPTVNGVGPVTITYTHTDVNGCTNSNTATLTVNDTSVVTVVFADDVACIDEAPFALTGGSPLGGTYSGTGVTTSPTFDPSVGASDHIITYTYTNGSGCTTSATDTMTVNPLPNVTLVLGDNDACSYESAFALTGGLPLGGTYSGTGVSGGNFDPKNPGGAGAKTITYAFTESATGCTNLATATLTVNDTSAVSLGDTSVCPGGNIVLSPSPNFGTKLWSTGSTNDTIHYNLPNTKVWVDVTDGNGCVSRATANISMGDILNVDFGVDKTICSYQSVTLDAAQFGPFQAPVTYDWDDLSGINQPSSRTLNQGGSYGVVVMDGRGCIGSDTAVITVNTPLAVKLPNDINVCFTGKETYTATIPNIYASQIWSTGSIDTFALVTGVSEIIVNTTDANNCVAADTMNVGEYCKPTVLCVPNVVTPNGDGLNDVFKPCQDKMKEITDGDYKSIMNNILEIHFQVFDRWGLKMFESSNVFPQWDGNFNGKRVAGGVYYWIITYTDSSHEKYELTGWVQVIE